MRYCRIILLICLWICFQSQSGFACRYNVRETGFIDLGSDPYYLYSYFNKNTPEEIISGFKQISHTTFIDCNIQVEMINIDMQKDHPAMKYLSKWQIQSFPVAILVSPDGRSLIIPIKKDKEPFEKSLRSALNNIIFSPIREEIIEEVIKRYGVILLIEGENAQENEKYRKIALSAIENIKNQMETMVKHIEYPPVLISMRPESFSHEKVLLWSLGIEADVTKPYAAVFYGRDRWIGPLMKADEISEPNLINILSIIGENCECGLDISWVEGTLLPVKWDQKRQAQVARLLEFDPENPLVKLEVSRIMKMGSSSYPSIPVMFSDSTLKSDLVSDGYIIDEKKSYLKVTLYFILGFVTLIITIVLILLIKAKRKSS